MNYVSSRCFYAKGVTAGDFEPEELEPARSDGFELVSKWEQIESLGQQPHGLAANATRSVSRFGITLALSLHRQSSACPIRFGPGRYLTEKAGNTARLQVSLHIAVVRNRSIGRKNVDCCLALRYLPCFRV